AGDSVVATQGVVRQLGQGDFTAPVASPDAGRPGIAKPRTAGVAVAWLVAGLCRHGRPHLAATAPGRSEKSKRPGDHTGPVPVDVFHRSCTFASDPGAHEAY